MFMAHTGITTDTRCERHPAMPEEAASQIKWPAVPACYGWLSLDRRGNWRLKSEIVRHPGLVSYLNSHYAPDMAGNWVVNNGPQRVFVGLDYTPLVWRFMEGVLFSHAGQVTGEAQSAYLDEAGNVLIACKEGIGLLDDRDLADFALECSNAPGSPAAHDDVLTGLAGSAELTWRGLRLQIIASADVAARFGFNPAPSPESQAQLPS